MVKNTLKVYPCVVRIEQGKSICPDSNKVKTEFDRWAKDKKENYDESTKHCPAYKIFPDKVISHLKGKDITDLLDVGCGTGLAGVPFIKKGLKVDGTDLSEKMMEFAKQRGYQKIVQIDLSKQELELGRKYNLIISVGVLGDYVLNEVALPKMIKIASDDAIIAFTSTKYATNKRNIKKILKSSDFEINEFELLPAFEGEGIRREKAHYIIASRGFN